MARHRREEAKDTPSCGERLSTLMHCGADRAHKFFYRPHAFAEAANGFPHREKYIAMPCNRCKPYAAAVSFTSALLERFRPDQADDPGRFASGTAVSLLAMAPGRRARHVAPPRLVPQTDLLELDQAGQGKNALVNTAASFRLPSSPDELLPAKHRTFAVHWHGSCVRRRVPQWQNLNELIVKGMVKNET
ncbi:hypothetical protein [Noviherbaspirillum aerium]|uniref:hypothetical protein n=1 Tax=Noviherbaspirillum aerium TaxID=2588497 RepID=UPI00124CF709|nr:hypothetical protein [Noviherbaspirillum aerium]